MALQITHPGNKVPANAINVLIYGQPSAGKTSLAYTMQKPLVLDFDGGAHRSAQSSYGTTVRAETWQDIHDLTHSDFFADFDTLVIDTVGSCLDMIATYIIATNPKFGTTKGTLTMQGWGELKTIFAAWFKHVNTLGKSVVMIAHHKEEKEGDNTRKRPDIQGSSYGLVLKQADFVGFAYLNEANRRVIGFAPTNDYFGKDSARLGVVAVDDYEANPTYGAGLLQTMRSAFADAADAHQATIDAVSNWKSVIDSWASPDDANAAIAQIAGLAPDIAAPVKKLAAAKVAALGLVFDKKTKTYLAEV